MKNQLTGFSKIFSFTFKQHAKSKGYKNSTIIIALLCLLIPAAIMIGSEWLSDDKTVEEPPVQEQEYQQDITEIKNIFAVDMSEDKKINWQDLQGILTYSGLEAKVSDFGGDFDKARELSKATDDTLIVMAEQTGDEYTLHIILPEESGLSESTAEGFDTILMAYADMLSVENGGEAFYYGDDQSADPFEQLDAVISMILTFLNLMVLYFFVLAYGQGVANSVVMEKSSKLMENFLVSVKPAAIVLGKLLAITLTGIVQLFSWILALVGGFAIGIVGTKAINPETDNFVVKGVEMLGELFDGMFTPLNCILALIMVMAGMLLYCGLAAIGGAMASKAEDLSSSNVIFTLVLVVSFLVSIYSGGFLDGEGALPILNWIPFTAVMIVPAQVLLGQLPLWQSVASLAIMLITTLIVTLGAGKIYKSLVLYRGEPLSPKKLIKMLKG